MCLYIATPCLSCACFATSLTLAHTLLFVTLYVLSFVALCCGFFVVVPCCAVRPLCCLPLVLSFRKGLWGRLWWVELSKPDRLVHRSTCTTNRHDASLVLGPARLAQEQLQLLFMLIESGHKLRPILLPSIDCSEVWSWFRFDISSMHYLVIQIDKKLKV